MATTERRSGRLVLAGCTKSTEEVIAGCEREYPADVSIFAAAREQHRDTLGGNGRLSTTSQRGRADEQNFEIVMILPPSRPPTLISGGKVSSIWEGL
jgi:hypothetical protein